ncbi:hypothetical protein ACYEXS_19745 [Paenibacillus sp. MAH-36]|uniref:Uncharacterized protein n=1 Tax=Paenibacillus violae TaxID=3077234 RepID=A0ABU3R7C0_9BACL|nr:hypothetical protein [Paenibacillus sp. PFR10]MDU0200177.1 hypothetical protein [Paenibacillus sp. PFR10]
MIGVWIVLGIILLLGVVAFINAKYGAVVKERQEQKGREQYEKALAAKEQKRQAKLK